MDGAMESPRLHGPIISPRRGPWPPPVPAGASGQGAQDPPLPGPLFSAHAISISSPPRPSRFGRN
eukprot:401508-Pyramimonas_sp.AAC.2